ncbi:diadenosine tetraphosphate hydrolase [Candidatus Woesearchaeota archaeon]|nr:diadenosine tetraphosphate hydrolase [Candidatus Woesearchaeota archaeon]|tara:strand:- start:36598 stop:37029 length:432 start_codon:yes stop_codon:yes gene_type:complete
MQEKSAGAIIYRKENSRIKYLLLLYGAGHWDYVKGNIETGEEEEETLVREAEEEAGLIDLKIIPGFRERISYFYTKNGKKIAKEVVFLLAETETEEIKLSSEHEKYKWLEFDKAAKQATFKTAKNLLKKADKFVKKYANQKTL